MLSKNDNKNYKSLAVAEMGNRLATMDMGQKLVGVPLWGSWAPYNVTWAVAYVLTKWHLDTSSHLATTDMG